MRAFFKKIDVEQHTYISAHIHAWIYYVHILVSGYVETICNRKHNTLFKDISINLLKLTKKHKRLYSTELNTSKH